LHKAGWRLAELFQKVL